MFNTFTRPTRLFTALGALTTAFALVGTEAHAQLQFKPSSLAASTTTWTPNASPTAIAVAPNTDDGLSAATPIGFNFSFNGKTMTHFILSTNGWIKLGTSAGMTPPSGPLGNVSPNQNLTTQAALFSTNVADIDIISVFNMDLEDKLAPVSLTPFNFKVTGSPGSQVCTIEFLDRRDYEASAGNIRFNLIQFQIRLLEGTNQIQFVYGPFTNGVLAATFNSPGVGVKANASGTPDGTLVIQKASPATAWSAAIANFRGIASTTTNTRSLINSSAAASTVGGLSTVYTLTPVSPFQANQRYPLSNIDNVAGTYTAVTGGSVITTADNDNSNSAELPIGFSFNYGGTTVDKFILNTNGYLKVGTTGMSAPSAGLFVASSGLPLDYTGPFYSQLASDVNLVIPFNLDLVAGTLTPEYRYQTTGSPGSRITTVQWANVRDKQTTNAVDAGTNIQIYDNVNFQVKFYEATGAIEFVYGTFTAPVTNRKPACIGLKGAKDMINQMVVANPTGTNWAGIPFSRTGLAHFSFYNNFLTGKSGSTTLIPDVGRTFRFRLLNANDLKPNFIYTFGKVPSPYGLPVTVQAIIANIGENDYPGGGNATVSVSGANTVAPTNGTIPAIAAGATGLVTFGTINPANLGTNTVTVTAPNDDFNGNNSLSTQLVTTTNSYSYKDAALPNTGGIGYNAGTGNFVAKFTSSSVNNINAVNVDFASPGGKLYEIIIYDDNAGTPGNLLYKSAVLTSPIIASGFQTALVNLCPSVTVNGVFYVGIRQRTTAQNVGFAYQSETPIRSGTFFSSSPFILGRDTLGLQSRGWTDFATSASPFKFSIEPQLEIGSVTPNQVVSPAPANNAVFTARNTTLSWSSAGGNPTDYDVFFGTNPGSLTKLVDDTCGNTLDRFRAGRFGQLTPGVKYYWRVDANNGFGTTTGVVWNFTVSPLPSNDLCANAIPLTPCTPVVSGFTNNATQSLAPANCTNPGPGLDNSNDDVWYAFVASSSGHTITVQYLDAGFDPVIEVGSGVCGAYTALACANLRPANFDEELTFGSFTPGQTYFVRVYGAGGVGTEGRFNIRISTKGGWTGDVSTAWGSPGNWCDNAVPVANSTVQILARTNQPTLSSSATIQNLSVNSGAILTLDPGVILDVRNDGASGGTLSGSGVVTGAGTLRLSAAGGQPAQSIATTGLTAREVSVTNSGTGITLLGGATLRVTDNFSAASNGKIINNGTVEFAGTSSRTARFGELQGTSTYAGTGFFTLERYINPGTGRWAFLGIPFQSPPASSPTLNQFSELRAVNNPLNNASIFYYQEADASLTFDPISQDTVERYGWRIPINFASAAAPSGDPLRGYRVYARPGFGGGQQVVSLTGVPYTGPVTKNLSFTPGQYEGGGWNLISNPYASDIDWNNVTTTANDAVFVYNGTGYQAYTKNAGASFGVGINGGTRFIPSSMSFFVKATAGSQSVSFTEASKSSGNASFIRMGEPNNLLRIVLKNARGQADEAAVYFAAGQTNGFDQAGDAVKFSGSILNLTTVADGGRKLSINGMSDNVNGAVVPLDMDVATQGTYTLNFSGMSNYLPTVSIMLRDRLNNTLTDVRTAPIYSFTINGNPASGGRRFEIVFSGAITALSKQLTAALSVWPNPASKGTRQQFGLQGVSSGKAQLVVMDALGRTVYVGTQFVDGLGETAYDLPASLGTGHYTLKVVTSGKSMVKTFIVE